ncbi:PRC-barrel domain-containing protein [Dongia sp.]|uniref:PRC-barrel domain-containing protein n=1 Tax=Dongia sp. TaxID=1977262 RepID=UPI0035B28CCB
MMKRLLLAATVTALPLGYSATAQDTPTNPPPVTVPAPSAQSGTDQSGTDTGTGAIAEMPAVAPPPAEAVIPAQRANEVRAESLIGTTVFSPEGEKVGTVKDILFDTNGQATGLVLSVGGIMGLGAKSVGLTWDEVEVQPEPKLLQVNYSEEQLEAAPSFKTQEAQQAESNTQIPPAAPAPSAPSAE